MLVLRVCAMFHEQVSNISGPTSGPTHATTVQPVLQVPNCAVHGICSMGSAFYYKGIVMSFHRFRLRLQGDVINENEQGHDRHDTRHRVNGLKNENGNANENENALAAARVTKALCSPS